jgi:hypothetical protein
MQSKPFGVLWNYDDPTLGYRNKVGDDALMPQHKKVELSVATMTMDRQMPATKKKLYCIRLPANVT